MTLSRRVLRVVRLAASVVAFVALSGVTVYAQTAGRGVSINFVGTGPAMAASESAGVVPKANWNAATGATNATGLALVDDAGATTNATATWRADGVWMSPIVDQAGNRRMMKGEIHRILQNPIYERRPADHRHGGRPRSGGL